MSSPSSSVGATAHPLQQRVFLLFLPLLLILCDLLTPLKVRAAGSRVPVQIFSSGATAHRLVALTFDDGPSIYSPQILAILARYHAHATFFLVGQHISQYAAAVKQEVSAGDELGNHTYNHFDVEGLPTGFVVDQLGRTQIAARVAGGVTPHWFRPPYGLSDVRVASIAAGLGLRTVLWSVDPRDWSRPGAGVIAARVLSAVQPGSVVVMHDGGGDRSETIAALAVILATLQARGYIFATLDEVFGLAPPPLCNAVQQQQAQHWFSSGGQGADPNHVLYQAWENMYCDGQNLGPATSKEYRIGPDIVAQDFARTGHRLEWNTQTHSAVATLAWPWAIAAFHARGIWPSWHTRITEDWFTQYFGGHDRGAALEHAHWDTNLHATTQCFERGCALAPRRGPVSWQAPKAMRG